MFSGLPPKADFPILELTPAANSSRRAATAASPRRRGSACGLRAGSGRACSHPASDAQPLWSNIAPIGSTNEVEEYPHTLVGKIISREQFIRLSLVDPAKVTRDS